MRGSSFHVVLSIMSLCSSTQCLSFSVLFMFVCVYDSLVHVLSVRTSQHIASYEFIASLSQNINKIITIYHK